MKRAATYTPQETAEIAGVTRRTVYEWLTSGRLPAFKRGPKLWVIYHEVLEAFLAGRDAQKVFERIQGKEGVLHVSPRSSLAPVALDRKPARAKRASVTVRQLTIDDTPQPETPPGIIDPDKAFPATWPKPEDKMPPGLAPHEQLNFRQKQQMIAAHRLKMSGKRDEPKEKQPQPAPVYQPGLLREAMNKEAKNKKPRR